MLEDILAAIGLMLIFEGVIPFLQPSQWRKMLASILEFDDRVVRSIGLVSMLVGAAVFYLIRLVGQ